MALYDSFKDRTADDGDRPLQHADILADKSRFQPRDEWQAAHGNTRDFDARMGRYAEAARKQGYSGPAAANKVEEMAADHRIKGMATDGLVRDGKAINEEIGGNRPPNDPSIDKDRRSAANEIRRARQDLCEEVGQEYHLRTKANGGKPVNASAISNDAIRAKDERLNELEAAYQKRYNAPSPSLKMDAAEMAERNRKRGGPGGGGPGAPGNFQRVRGEDGGRDR